MRIVVWQSVCFDAQQCFVRVGVFLVDIVRVVCGNEREAVMLGHLGEDRIYFLLFRHAVVHQLDQKIVFAEDGYVFQDALVRRIEIIFKNTLGNLPRKTGARSDQALAILLE